MASRTGLIEAADGGTLFLDEIGELPVEAQARLLRFIQEDEIRRIGSVQSRKVDVRLICATQRDHVVSLQEGGTDDEANTQGLCQTCHDEKSERERLRALARSRG